MPRAARPIVIIGAGGIVADAHLPAYRKAGFPVAAICDLSAERARSLAGRFGIEQAFGSVADAITAAPPGAVYDLATPPSAFRGVLEQLPPGAAVLIQKPFGETLAEARAIRDLCRARRLTAAVNFQLRFAPAIEAARSMIEGGTIGEVHDMEVRVTVYMPWHLWTFLEAAPRVEILYHSIHYIDLIRTFLGDPKSVYAKTVKHPSTMKLASTRSNIILDYGDLLRANITANHGHVYGLRNQEAYVKWEGTGGAIRTRLGLLLNYPKGEPDNFEYTVLENGRPSEWTEVPLPGTWFPDGFLGTMAHFQRYLEGSAQELPNSVDDAVKTMAVVEAAYRSSESGGTPVSYD